MKLHPLALASTLTLLSLTGCGGGGESSEQTSTDPITSSTHVFLGLNNNDNYVGTVLSKEASYSFYEDTTGNSLYELIQIYKSELGTVLFAQSQNSANVDFIQIDDYLFEFLSNTDGTSVVTVTKPDNSQESYHFDENNQLEGADNEPDVPADEPEVPSVGGSCAIQASTMGVLSGYCFANYDSYYSSPAISCSVAELESANPTGDVTFLSANYSATQTCAEQGFPYYGANDVWWNNKEIADAQSEAVGSMTRQLPASTLRAETATCVDLNSSDTTQITDCIETEMQSISNVLPADSKFIKVLDTVIKKDFASFEKLFSMATAFADSIPALLEGNDNQVVGALAEFPSSVLDDHIISQNISQMLEAMDEFFEDYENGTLEDSYPGIGSLNDIYGEDGKGIMEEEDAAITDTDNCILLDYLDLDPAIGGPVGKICKAGDYYGSNLYNDALDDVERVATELTINDVINHPDTSAIDSMFFRIEGVVDYYLPDSQGKLFNVLSTKMQDGLFDGTYISRYETGQLAFVRHYTNGARTVTPEQRYVYLCEQKSEFNGETVSYVGICDEVYITTPVKGYALYEETTYAADLGAADVHFEQYPTFPTTPDYKEGRYVRYDVSTAGENVLIEGQYSAQERFSEFTTLSGERSGEWTYYAGKCLESGSHTLPYTWYKKETYGQNATGLNLIITSSSNPEVVGFNYSDGSWGDVDGIDDDCIYLIN